MKRDELRMYIEGDSWLMKKKIQLYRNYIVTRVFKIEAGVCHEGQEGVSWELRRRAVKGCKDIHLKTED